MKTLIFIFHFFCIINISNAQSIKGFFKPLSKQNAQFLTKAVTEKQWLWRPVVSIPALKILESERKDALIDALLLTSTGGGISLQRVFKDKDGRFESDISWSPITFLLSGNLTADSPLDLSVASTFGIANNAIMIGLGYDLGEVIDRNRLFFVLSIGINFNN